MLARAARPKLALAVPTGPVASVAIKSPVLRTPVSPSPISPTVRNTRLNQRGASTLQVPSFAYAQNPSTKSILKKSQASSSLGAKKLQFNEELGVRCITPVPADYHGTYVKMSKEERRWGKGHMSLFQERISSNMCFSAHVLADVSESHLGRVPQDTQWPIDTLFGAGRHWIQPTESSKPCPMTPDTQEASTEIGVKSTLCHTSPCWKWGWWDI
ncbi:MAG: hypothetical protein LQ346_001827 [Caloplaca aetnensis]|nr:MAG: hypothetical protein LQ346_001827 [Caloplaca aetnensis]